MNREPTWKNLLAEEKNKDYFKSVMQFVKSERAKGKTIYPKQRDIFNALKYTPFESVKIVILGQDPYHGPNQAHGLCFSVQPGVPTPPSLLNIYKEQANDIGITIPGHGCLEKWATQGVLLLNTVLTVEQHKAHSHAKKGWETFTDQVISALNHHPNPIVFMLWGAHAKSKIPLIDTKRHKVLTAPHPSPLSAHRGFMGCKHFSKANALLTAAGRDPIDWSL